MKNSKAASLIGNKNTIRTTQNKEKNKTVVGTFMGGVILLLSASLYFTLNPSLRDIEQSESTPISVAEHTFVTDTPDEFSNEKVKTIMSATSDIDLSIKENQHNLGMKYLLGDGVERNYQEAIGWFTLAAKQDHKDSQGMLGQIYYQGELVQKNDKQAVIWSILAASKGLKEAQYTLGLLYEEGRGVKQNDIEAFKWFTLSANQGMLRAQEKVVQYKTEKSHLINARTTTKSPQQIISKDDSSEVNKYLSGIEQKKLPTNKENIPKEIIWN